MVVTHKFKLYLDSWQDPVTLDAVQGDTARNIQFSLYAENALWEIPADTQVMVRYRKSDNTGGCYDTLPGGSVAYHIVDNQITVHLVPQVLTVAGIVEMQIALFNSTQTLAAFSVLIRVQGDPSVGVLESENYVNLSTWLRGELDQRMAEAVDSGGYLNSKVDDLHSRILPLFSQGGLESGTGEEISQTTAIRSNLILLGGQELSVTVPAGVTVRCFFYDMVGRYTGETEYYSHSFTVYRDAAHIRLVAAYSDDSVVGDPAALAEKVGIFLNVNSHHSFRGSVKKHGFASFAQCTQEGYYQFDTSEIGMIQDAPAITAGGILEVRSHFGPDAALQTIKTANGEIWFRIGNDPFQKLLPQDPHFLYVTVWHNGEKWVADKTFDVLHDWILAGNGAYCFFDVGDILRLAKLEAEGLTFSGSSNGWETTVFISVDNVLSVSQLELSEASDIPNSLPNPNKLTLTGAVSAEYDGSKPVSIVIPQGGHSAWNMIMCVELAEETAVINQAVSGYEEYMIFVRAIPGSANTNNAPLVIDVHAGNSVERYSVDAGILDGTKAVTTQAYFCKPIDSCWVYGILSRKGGNTYSGEYGYTHNPLNQITGFNIYTSVLEHTFGVGTNIAIYGR